MKILVIGGTRLMGSQKMSKLRALGHNVMDATPSNGINAGREQGLVEAVGGADNPLKVIRDKNALHFGAHLEQSTLIPKSGDILGKMKYMEWSPNPL